MSGESDQTEIEVPTLDETVIPDEMEDREEELVLPPPPPILWEEDEPFVEEDVPVEEGDEALVKTGDDDSYDDQGI